MRGVQYVTDEKGERTAVIDLKKNGELWEDFHDYIISHEREKETRETLASVKKRIMKNGKR